MSIFNRIRDLLSANVNSMLDSAEDPEKMAEEYLRQLNNELYEAKTNVASAMADATKLNTRETQYTVETDQWATKAEAALRAGNEELAKVIVVDRTRTPPHVEERKVVRGRSAGKERHVHRLFTAAEQIGMMGANPEVAEVDCQSSRSSQGLGIELEPARLAAARQTPVGHDDVGRSAGACDRGPVDPRG